MHRLYRTLVRRVYDVEFESCRPDALRVRDQEGPFADLVEYLVGRVDTIPSDAELFVGLDQEQLANNGKIGKSRSSQSLIRKIEDIKTLQSS